MNQQTYPTPQTMLDHYRGMGDPVAAVQMPDFKKMSIAERDELLYYGLLYATKQLGAILQWIEMMTAKQPGKPN